MTDSLNSKMLAECSPPAMNMSTDEAISDSPSRSRRGSGSSKKYMFNFSPSELVNKMTEKKNKLANYLNEYEMSNLSTKTK